MKRLTSAEVRQMFLDFFKEKGHDVEPSASLVPHEDPSLLWINSGVATLKKYFDGRVIPNNPRITNAQKSIRTNDIENVGKTARHHTFFEMLGNFSIGDYFKKESIQWAWEFLTSERWIGFDPEKLSVTIHPNDDEAFDLWNKEVGLPEERIIRLEENFWDIGEGPSGPNTEIFYDRGPAYGDDMDDPEMFPGGENERYLEIWNLVFSQYNHNPDGSYTPLPKKNIDTGMGLERMVSVIQDAETNFDTDLFVPIIRKTEGISGRTYGKSAEEDTAFKVIADHVRTVTFAVSDGALPSNEGRGYVLRRLLRRAVRYAKQIGIERPFMYELVPTVADIMNDFYPEVSEKTDFIQKVMKNEEERFHETLNDGLTILNKVMKQAREQGKTEISGEDVFRLYDTYGFPSDLTQEYVEDEGFHVDLEGFEREMEKQRERARAARQESESMQIQDKILGEIEVESSFIGYDHTEAEAGVQTIVKDGAFVDVVGEGEDAQVILDQTPFYAESGGQVADTGTFTHADTIVDVVDVQAAPNGQNLHSVKVTKGTLRTGMNVTAQVSTNERVSTIKNHTATHLLHQALKDVLGEHVNQAGSLVNEDRLRFDFSHFGQVTEEEMNQIEAIVNEKVWQAQPVERLHQTLDEAKEMGAMALFGEKYGDEVRVIKIGDYSIELCGGCHVNNTAEVGVFKIISEAGIGAGVRRIEAVTGKKAYEYLNGQLNVLRDAADRLKTNINEVPQRIEQLQQQLKDVERENESLSAKLGNMEASSLLDETIDVEGVSVLAQQVDVPDMDRLRQLTDSLKEKMESGILVLASVNNGKVQIVTTVTDDLVKEGYHAGNIIKEVATRCGGGGGGRPNMAQAGGKDPEKVPEALKIVPEIVKTNS
ncbi:alanine--tRNA ligase [Texcoconibacillus texcoconensis]|uniref:Alanine--tRNA ligase n=1 Tax=Texcoconibacillus texcoconensis TaxID=1095777 RepID=A0A840QPC4_9BACI|nr:alanine--tRNA ligase [Texcoconibacillus texcoconensis]MBB5173177.1 alanyl-tRNA synthetase [Texcoconibacillus texcoconensis]